MLEDCYNEHEGNRIFHETTHVVLVVHDGHSHCRNTVISTDAQVGRSGGIGQTGYGRGVVSWS